MNRESLLSKIPNNPELDQLEPSYFLLKYITKLLHNLILFVEPSVSIGKITNSTSFTGSQKFMQKIIGIPSAYTAVDGEKEALIQFAEKYSHMGITEYNDLMRDVIVDFLNLHNGLFVVDLSREDSIELSLEPPTQEISPSDKHLKSLARIPVTFSFGELVFSLVELD